MQIAIDGPAGAGKSTIAKKIAKLYDITYLDTGAMYRCLTYAVLNKHGNQFDDQDVMIKLARAIQIEFLEDQIFCNGEDVTLKIRTPLVSKHTSDVAKIREVREILVEQQREFAKKKSVIMDGRDIGSVVLPDAEYKFFLDADVLERAKRRKKEMDEKKVENDLKTIQRDIEKRDHEDQKRLEGPLIKVKDAITIDTTGLSIDGVIAVIQNYIDGVENDL